MTLPKIWVLTITGLLVLLFIYTGLSKLLDFPEFSSQMRNQPLPLWVSKLVTWTLPLLELLIAALLVSNKLRTLGLLMALTMMIIFTVYIILILLSTFDYIPCSCAGIFKQMNWHTHLAVNIIVTVLTFIAYYTQRKIHLFETHQDIPR